jgi:hypothetical protein
MDEPLPTYAIPAQSRPSRKYLYLTIAGAAILILLAGLTAWLYLTPSGQRTMDALSLPQELHTAEFFVAGPHGKMAYRWDMWRYVSVDAPSDGPMDRSGNHIAVIQHASAAQFTITLDGKQVVQANAPLASVALSPDGTKIAYTQLWSLHEASTTNAHASSTTTQKSGSGTAPTQITAKGDTGDWRIMYLDTIAGGVPQVVGQGVSPVFVSDTALVRFAASGVMEYDFTKHTDRVIASNHVTNPLSRAVVSPDRVHIAWYDATAYTLTVARIGDSLTGPISYPLHTSNFSLTNTDLYWMSGSNVSNMLVRQPIAGGTPVAVHNFSSAFPVTSISL